MGVLAPPRSVVEHSRLAEGWRSTIYLAQEKAVQEKILRNFLNMQGRHRMSHQRSKVNLQIHVQAFVLDLSISPDMISVSKAAKHEQAATL